MVEALSPQLKPGPEGDGFLAEGHKLAELLHVSGTRLGGAIVTPYCLGCGCSVRSGWLGMSD